MSQARFKIEYPRRQAMLKVVDRSTFNPDTGACASRRVPVFVWPMPTTEGLFVVEHQDGSCERVQPNALTFLDGRELFDQYDWSE